MKIQNDKNYLPVIDRTVIPCLISNPNPPHILMLKHFLHAKLYENDVILLKFLIN